MPRATVIVSGDDPTEVAAVENWFSRWATKLAHRSENHGCGCCVDIWEIEAPAEAIADLPPQVYAGDEWSNGG
jgi:hypothetical protein